MTTILFAVLLQISSPQLDDCFQRQDDQSNPLAQTEISGLVINSVLEKKKK